MSCRYALSALLSLTLLASGCAGGFSRHYQAADDHVRPVDTLESCTAPRVEKIPASVMEERLAAALADGDRGAVTLELDRREDVLYVNASAVKHMDDKRFVYVQDENGLRAMAEVETGFEAGGFVEILSGLEEGDAVILK